MILNGSFLTSQKIKCHQSLLIFLLIQIKLNEQHSHKPHMCHAVLGEQNRGKQRKGVPMAQRDGTSRIKSEYTLEKKTKIGM